METKTLKEVKDELTLTENVVTTINLFNGDCLIEMKQIKSGSVDMILCDLPYGITKNAWDIIIPFDKLY